MTIQGYRRYPRLPGPGEIVESRIPDSPVPTKLALLLAEYHWKRQGMVAKDLDISGPTFNRYVNGTALISSEHLVRICRYFQRNPNEVLGFADDIKDFNGSC